MPNSYYLDRIFDPVKLHYAVDLAAHLLIEVDYDSIAVRGISGIAFGATLSYATGKGLIVVRKPNDTIHASYEIEGKVTNSYIFVDDLVSSGDTQRAVVNGLKKDRHYKNMKYVGQYLYNAAKFTPATPESKPLTEVSDIDIVEKEKEYTNDTISISSDERGLSYETWGRPSVEGNPGTA